MSRQPKRTCCDSHFGPGRVPREVDRCSWRSGLQHGSVRLVNDFGKWTEAVRHCPTIPYRQFVVLLRLGLRVAHTSFGRNISLLGMPTVMIMKAGR